MLISVIGSSEGALSDDVGEIFTLEVGHRKREPRCFGVLFGSDMGALIVLPVKKMVNM